MKGSRSFPAIASLVGAEDRWQNSQIAFVDGEQGPPMPLLKRGVLSYLDLHVNGTLAYTQAASTAAVTGNALFPWGLVRQYETDVGANTKFNASVGGYDLMVWETYRHPSYAPAYTAPLPPANSGSSSVSGNLSWSWRQRLPVSVDEADLTGLVLLDRPDAETVAQIYWRHVSSLLTVPSGSSVSFTGAANITAYGYQLGQLGNPKYASVLGVAHVLQAVPVTVPSQTEIMVPLLLNRSIQAIFMIPYVDGIPDTTSQIAVDKVILQIGDARPVSLSAAELRFNDQLRARGNIPAGVLVLDRMRNRPTQYLNLFTVNQAFVTIQFASAPPAGATFNFLYEYLR